MNPMTTHGFPDYDFDNQVMELRREGYGIRAAKRKVDRDRRKKFGRMKNKRKR